MAPRGSTSGWRRLSCGGLASPRGLFRRITHRVPMCGLLWWTRGRGRRRTGLWRGRTNGYGRLTCMPVVFSRYIHSFVRCGPRRTYLLPCEKHKYLGARCSAYEMPRRSRRGVSLDTPYIPAIHGGDIRRQRKKRARHGGRFSPCVSKHKYLVVAACRPEKPPVYGGESHC